MTQKTDYTEQEWELIKTAPLVTGMGVAAVDYGFVSMLRELKAVTEAVPVPHEIGAKLDEFDTLYEGLSASAQRRSA